jgi:hypothetical protein
MNTLKKKNDRKRIDRLAISCRICHFSGGIQYLFMFDIHTIVSAALLSSECCGSLTFLLVHPELVEGGEGRLACLASVRWFYVVSFDQMNVQFCHVLELECAVIASEVLFYGVDSTHMPSQSFFAQQSCITLLAIKRLAELAIDVLGHVSGHVALSV